MFLLHLLVIDGGTPISLKVDYAPLTMGYNDLGPITRGWWSMWKIRAI